MAEQLLQIYNGECGENNYICMSVCGEHEYAISCGGVILVDVVVIVVKTVRSTSFVVEIYNRPKDEIQTKTTTVCHCVFPYWVLDILPHLRIMVFLSILPFALLYASLTLYHLVLPAVDIINCYVLMSANCFVFKKIK